MADGVAGVEAVVDAVGVVVTVDVVDKETVVPVWCCIELVLVWVLGVPAGAGGSMTAEPAVAWLDVVAVMVFDAV